MNNPLKKVNKYCLIFVGMGFILFTLMFILTIPIGIIWLNSLSIPLGMLLFSVAYVVFGDFQIEGSKNTTHRFFDSVCLVLFLFSLVVLIFFSTRLFSDLPKSDMFLLTSVCSVVLTVIVVFMTYRKFKVEDDLILVRENGEILYSGTVFKVNPFLENNFRVVKQQYDLIPVNIPFVTENGNFNMIVQISVSIDFQDAQEKSVRQINLTKFEGSLEFWALYHARERVRISKTMDDAVRSLHGCNDVLNIDGGYGKIKVVVKREKPIEIEFVKNQ